MSFTPQYSVVVPVFNSEKTLDELCTRVSSVFQKINQSFEIILVNDCSKDGSWRVIQQLKEKFGEKVTGISLRGNFGQHKALLCGFQFAKGEYIITIDDDLQFFPEDIELLIVKTNSTSADFFNNNTLFIGLFVVIVLCVIIAYTLYKLIGEKLFLNIRQVVEDTKIPVICTGGKKQYQFKLEESGNGERRSYTFWIYIHDMNKYNNMYKNVFNIQGSKTEINPIKASPFIFLDKTNNRMYVRFAKNSSVVNADLASTITTFSGVNGLTDSTLINFMKQGIVIPYVPLQRWVHIGIVFNSNAFKNSLYAYVDGTLVNTTSTGELDQYLGGTQDTKKNIDNIDVNGSGFINIGGGIDAVEGTGFSGLVAKITTYNYELNVRDIYNDYYTKNYMI